MNPHSVVPVVLSGGSGTRLWPASRPDNPKQLLALVEERTMLHATIDRGQAVPDSAAPVVVCSESQLPLIVEQLAVAGCSDAEVLVEPMPRNTAPAVAAAALATLDDDPILLVQPADHVIINTDAFVEAVSAGAVAAAAGKLVTFGIVPDHPATGFGYIRSGDRLGSGPELTINAFVEKPDAARAAEFLAAGDYLWNSGMFMFRSSVLLAELERFAPEMAAAVGAAVAKADGAIGVKRLDVEAFAESPSDSIDYAVMEHTTEGVVIPLDAGWSDVGSWSSLHEVSDRDGDGNATVGDVLVLDTADSYVRSSGPLLTTIGLSNVVAVATPDAVLVADMGKSEEVKTIVADLRSLDRPEATRSLGATAAWGSLTTLSSDDESAVREAMVNPYQEATLNGRHFTVRSGRVRRGDQSYAAGQGWAEDGSGPVVVVNATDQPARVIIVEAG
jgi:mannose-1-phosphate guanylyltransferase/mannose-6-phosphate isomerase